MSQPSQRERDVSAPSGAQNRQHRDTKSNAKRKEPVPSSFLQWTEYLDIFSTTDSPKKLCGITLLLTIVAAIGNHASSRQSRISSLIQTLAIGTFMGGFALTARTMVNLLEEKLQEQAGINVCIFKALEGVHSRMCALERGQTSIVQALYAFNDATIPRDGLDQVFLERQERLEVQMAQIKMSTEVTKDAMERMREEMKTLGSAMVDLRNQIQKKHT